MKPFSRPRFNARKAHAGAVLLVTSLLLTACATPSARIRRNPEVFATFPESAREKIQAGEIEVGFTPDMVRMAKGEPNRVYRRETEADASLIWQYERVENHIRTMHVNVYGRGRHASDGFVHVQDPRQVISQRIEFRNGNVTSIETLTE